MSKFKKTVNGINQFFRNLVAANRFAKVEEQVGKHHESIKVLPQLEQDIRDHTATLEKIVETLDNLQKNLDTRLNGIDDNITNMRYETRKTSSDIEKVKKGLQEEVGESLERLCQRCKDQGFSTMDEKKTAQRFYDSIHELGINGWSEALYEIIMKM